MLQEALPDSIRQTLETHNLARPALLTTSADLTLDGRFARHWLIVHGDSLAIVAEDGHALERRLPIAEVESFRAHAVRRLRLLAGPLVDGVWVDLVRYSNSLASRFAKVAGKLEGLRTDGALVVRPERRRRRAPLPAAAAWR